MGFQALDAIQPAELVEFVPATGLQQSALNSLASNFRESIHFPPLLLKYIYQYSLSVWNVFVLFCLSQTPGIAIINKISNSSDILK